MLPIMKWQELAASSMSKIQRALPIYQQMHTNPKEKLVRLV
jgi:hypothetical protein